MYRKTIILFSFLLLNAPFGFGKDVSDSLVSQLDGNNLTVLHHQLDQLLSSQTLGKINPDPSQWPQLMVSIAGKVIQKIPEFDESGQAIALSDLSQALLASKISRQTAYDYIGKALRMANRLKEHPRSYVYHRYAIILMYVNRYDSAVFYAEKAYDLARELKADSVEKESLDLMGRLCYKSKNYTKGKDILKKLIAHKRSTPRQVMDYHNTIGLIMRNEKIYDSSHFYFDKALQYANLLKDTAWIGLTSGNSGYIYFLQGKYDEALAGIKKDIALSFKVKNNESALNALTTLIRIYLTQHNLKQAKVFFDSLNHGMKSNESTAVKFEFLKIAADYYEKINKPDSALKYLKIYIVENDSLSARQKNIQAIQMANEFELDRHVRQIKQLELLNEIESNKNTNKNYFILAFLVIIAISMVLIFVQYKSNAFKNRANKLLLEQNFKITQQAQHLDELNQTKNKLFTIISHDLQGPVGSLKSLLSLVRRNLISKEEFDTMSEKLGNSVDQMYFTLNNLLQWAGSQLNGSYINPVRLKVKHTVDKNFNFLKEQARLKNINLQNHVREEATVTADADHLDLVLRNLISNSIKFTQPGGMITVSSSTEDSKETIAVADTGIGIEHEKLDKMFRIQSNNFTRGTSGEKGTGLGLALCKEVIEKNGGHIKVESQPGVGTTIKLSLAV